MKKLLQSLFLMLFIAFQAVAQERTVSGTVTDMSDGLSLPGVSVKVKGANFGTSTGGDGRYSIVVPANSTLQFSFIGYTTKEVLIGTGTVNVALVSDATQLGEVVVTGYSVVSRERFSGSASTVSSKAIEQIPNPSFDQILQGRAPGLTVQAGSGQPGANNTRVIIRGQGSISGGSQPLYVIDGIPVESGVFSTMNPNDYESVTVLKDASSTAPYGSRGANGVIVINTKKGKAGATNIAYRTQHGFSDRTRSKFEMLNTQDRLQYENELGQRGILTTLPGWAFAKNNPTYAQQTAAVQGRRDQILDSLSNINTDWEDIFFTTGTTNQHELNISGGNERTKFYTSGAYFKQEGIARRSNLERLNLRVNLDHKAGKFDIGIQSAAGFSKSNGIESEGNIALANPFAAVYLLRPYENPYLPNGNIGTSNPTSNPLGLTNIGSQGYTIYDNRTGSNALSRIGNTQNRFNQFKGTLGVNGRYKILDYLVAKSTTGIDFRETNITGFVNPASHAGTSVATGNQGSFSENLQRNFKFINTSGLEFTKTFNSVHNLNSQVLFEVIRDNFKRFNYTGFGVNAKLPETPAGVSAGTATNNFIPVVGGALTGRGIVSYIGLVNYAYSNRYVIDASFRRDGSSLVPEQNRFRNFYSLGGSWNVSNENFFEGIDFVNSLKLRASYGKSANADGFTGDFNYLPTYGAITYAGTPAIAPARPADPNYDWEFNTTTNIGLDFQMWSNRIRGYADVYNRKTDNLFVAENLSRTTGFASLNKNAGVVVNRGIEASLSIDVLSKTNLVWTIDANFGYNKNEVTNLGQVNEFEQGTSIIRVGLPLGSHYSVEWAGVDPQNGDPLYRTKDGQVTNTYSASNSVANFGSFNPPFTGGFGSTLRYKGVELSGLFSFASEFYRFNNESFFLTNSGQSGFNQRTKMLTDSWKKPGDNAELPRYGVQRNFTSYDIEDASYLRLRNVTLGYTLPTALSERLKVIKGARFYIQGQNLATWTKWSGFDPEDNNNIAAFEYPAARTYTFGLDVNF